MPCSIPRRTEQVRVGFFPILNFQVPFEAPMTGAAQVIVTKNGVPSQPAIVQVQEYAPGVFMYERTPGVLDPIIVRTNGNIVSPGNPALPSDILVVYATGLGNLTTLPTTGEVSPLSPLVRSSATPMITVGGVPAEVQFSGLTPGAIGLAQFNIKLPPTLAQTDSLPLVIHFGNVSSPTVNMAIRSTPARPDVTIQVTDVQPRTPLATDNMWLAEDVKNPSSFRGDLVTKLYVSQSLQVAVDSAQASAPATLTLNGTGGSYTWSPVALPQGLKPGIYYVAIGTMFPGNTDPGGVVLSNATQIEIVAQRSPFDLVVQLKDVSPLSVGAGDPIAVHYTVSEASGMSGSFSRSLYLSSVPAISTSGILINTRTFDLVKGRVDLTSTGNSIPRGVAPGNYFVGVIVETSGDLNPSNNTSSPLLITVTSQRAPFDIGVQIVSATPATITPGGTFTVTYDVRNASKSTGIYNRWVYLSTDQTISTSDQLLSAGTFILSGDDASFTTLPITLPSSVAAGKYYLGVIVENQGDTNPADNTSTAIPIQVGPSTGTIDASAHDTEKSAPEADPKKLPVEPTRSGESETRGLARKQSPQPLPARQ